MSYSLGHYHLSFICEQDWPVSSFPFYKAFVECRPYSCLSRFDCSLIRHVLQTSVLCGIMRLSILQIMLGTLPVIVLIIPSCLTGSLLYMASLVTDTGNPVFPWAGTLSTITASVTAVVQFASMIVAAYYLEQASDKYASEIAAIDDDIEVKEADARDEHIRDCYKKVTQWNSMPMMSKLLLSFSLVSITASCYMVCSEYGSRRNRVCLLT